MTKNQQVKNIAPYGCWPSPVTAAMVAGKTPKISDLRLAGDAVYWCEVLAAEKSRAAIMRYREGQLQCVLPRPLSAKSKVHEYGGAPYCVEEECLYFVLADDQRIYRLDLSANNPLPEALTPEGYGYRFADLVFDRQRQRLIAVCEEHRDAGEVLNYLVAVAAPPGTEPAKPLVLASGADFYSSPRVSPDGRQLCWLSWNHPAMPWDNSALWLAELEAGGLSQVRKVAGNGRESLFQPEWSPQGDVFFVSDRSDWWNIYAIKQAALAASAADGELEPECILAMPAEFATPPWVFGMATWGFLNESTLLAACSSQGRWQLGEIALPADPKDKASWTPIAAAPSVIESVFCAAGAAVFIGADMDKFAQVYRYQSGHLQTLTDSPALIAPEDCSQAQSITFPTSAGQQAQALFYPPTNARYRAPGREDDASEKPPLIVLCHGGPTGATNSGLNLKIQYWTSRGFAVADVNYRGSTGYGRRYRQLLNGQWGVYDVDDVCAVVDFLAGQGWVDAERAIIKGSSAGAYTALAALAFRQTFRAGVSLYGIGDLELLVADTHKFEARYLDQLIGPYPQQQSLYRQRSPLHFAADIRCPLLLLQGMQDKVVPPSQAQSLYATLKTQGQPVALVCYPEEAHGFRAADTIEHSLRVEMQFYAKVFRLPVSVEEKVGLVIENCPD